MKKYRKILFLAVACGVLCVFSNMSHVKELQLSDIIFRIAFGYAWYDIVYIVPIMALFLPLFLFQILCGSMIYRYFCCASVYYFTRNGNRIKWFLMECGKLYVTTIGFLVVMFLSGTIALSFVSDITIDQDVLWMGGFYFLLHSLFLFSFTLAINVLSIVWNSTAGIVIPVGIQLMSIAFYTMLSGFSNTESGGLSPENAWMIYGNPFAQIVFRIHTIDGKAISSVLGEEAFTFDLRTSVVYMAVVAVSVIVGGCVVVHNHEFITNDKELE